MVEVREGYKITKLGEIPDNWEIATLQDITEKITDGSHTSPKELDVSEYKISSVKHMGKSNLNFEDSLPISKEDYEKLVKNGCKPKNNDVLLSKDGTIGKVLLYNQEELNLVLLSSIAIIRCNNKIILPTYLKQFLSNPTTLKKLIGMKTGSAIKRIVLKDINILKIILPPLEEQEKIAEILSVFDTQIEQTKQLIENTKLLKKGLMQQLLTKGIGHTEYKHSELGDMPNEWTFSDFEDILVFVGSGVTPKGGREVYETEGVLFIRSQNVYPAKLKLQDAAYISQDIHNKMKRTKVLPADVLLNITGASIGRCTIFPKHLGEANVNQHVCILRGNEKIDNAYLMYFLNSELGQRQIFKEQLGQTREGLNFQQIKSFKIGLPTIAEQKKVIEILSTVDTQIESYEKEKAKYEELKKGLMQQLLTGKVRVKVD